MNEFKILRLLDLIQGLYRSLGVDYPVMRKILKLKLLMDERRVPTILKQNNNKAQGNLFKKSLLVYGITGLFLAIFIPLPFPLFYKMNLVFGMLIFMVMSVMVSDYSSVLLDIQEKNILLPKPVNLKTINAAKVTHIIFYLSTILMVMAGPSLVFGSIRYGLAFGLIYLIELMLILGLVIFLTAILYFFVLQFFDGERLKDMINFFQIILAVAMMLVYQLIGRVFEFVSFDVTFIPKWWSYLLPSTWFAAPFMIFIEGQQEPHFIAMSLMALVVPLVLLVCYLKGIAPYFERNLQKLNNHGGKKPNKKINQKWGIAKIIRNPVERSSYGFSKAVLKSERSLKLKLYPNLAFSGMAPLIIFIRPLTESSSFSQLKQEITNGRYYLFAYVSIMLLGSCLALLHTSERPQGAWLYQVLPVEKPGDVVKGALEAFFIKMLLPPFLLICLLYTVFYGLPVIPQLMVLLLNLVLLLMIIFNRSHKSLPFSNDFEYIKHSGATVFLMIMPFCGLSAAIHWFFIDKGYPLSIYMALILLSTYILWNRSFRFTWQDLMADQNEV